MLINFGQINWKVPIGVIYRLENFKFPSRLFGEKREYFYSSKEINQIFHNICHDSHG